MLVERGRALEIGAPEPQAVGAGGIWGEHFVVDVENEEYRAVLYIGGNKIVWFPGVDGNNRVFCEKPSLIADVDASRRSTDMKNQMPFAMRMHVEGPVQLIDRRATKQAVEDGQSLAHAFPPAGMFSCLFNQRSTSAAGMQGKITSSLGPSGPRRVTGARSQMRRAQYFLHSGTVRLGSPILEKTAGS